jgi:DNA-binding transcriptional LysR family regulator
LLSPRSDLRRLRGELPVKHQPPPHRRRPDLLISRRPDDSLANHRHSAWIGGCNRCEAELLAVCRRARFTPRIASLSDDMVVVQSLVAAGIGVATLPGLALQAHRRPGVHHRTHQLPPPGLRRHPRRPTRPARRRRRTGGTHRSNHADDIDRDRHHRHQHVLDRIAVNQISPNNPTRQEVISEPRDRLIHRS